MFRKTSLGFNSTNSGRIQNQLFRNLSLSPAHSMSTANPSVSRDRENQSEGQSRCSLSKSC